MANNAHLFRSDDASELEWSEGIEGDFVSHNNLPFAWLLFFNPEHIVLRPIRHGNWTWNEIYLAAPWAEARSLFLERAPHLTTWFQNRIEAADAAAFLENLEADQGHFLILDPQEIIRDQDDKKCASDWKKMLTALQAGIFMPEELSVHGFSFRDTLNRADKRWLKTSIFGG